MATASSASRSSNSRAARLQQQRLVAFKELLDPTNLLPGHAVADLYSLRHLCLQGDGVPDEAESSSAPLLRSQAQSAARSGSRGWIRAQAWKVLLGYLPPEKAEWQATLAQRRQDYWCFVEDLAPVENESQAASNGNLSSQDALLLQIYRDLSRSTKIGLALSDRQDGASTDVQKPRSEGGRKESAAASVPSTRRHAYLQRLRQICPDYVQAILSEQVSSRFRSPEAKSTHLDVASPEPSGTSPDEAFLTPTEEDAGQYFDTHIQDVRWHSLLRVLFICARLNPSVSYVQGMHEILSVLFLVFVSSAPPPSRASQSLSRRERGSSKASGNALELTEAGQSGDSLLSRASSASAAGDEAAEWALAEADAFWCFSALMSETRDMYDFSGVIAGDPLLQPERDQQQARPSTDLGGMSHVLRKLSLRLLWLDEELWSALRANSLDPILPYYSLRWVSCLLSTELPVSSAVRVFDVLFSEVDEGGPSADACNAKTELLIDICTAFITVRRMALLAALRSTESAESNADDGEAFARGMQILQHSTGDDIDTVLSIALVTRQRRKAADLTDDRPPEVFPDDVPQMSMKSAVATLRSWTASSSPSTTKPSWLYSSPRRVGSGANSSQENASPSIRIQQYADALSESDAAATLRKASSNLQAKALARREASNEAADSPTGARKTSAGFFQTLKGVAGQSANVPQLGSVRDGEESRALDHGSANALLSASQPTTLHPALRWSQAGPPPDLPLPDMADSPPGRYSQNMLSPTDASFRSRNGSVGNASHDSALADRSADSSLFGRFAHLPSLANIDGSAKNANSSAGPKPLLLQRSAGPPREKPQHEKLASEPMSRKVSSGPLAGPAAAASSASSSSSQGARETASARSSGSRRPSATEDSRRPSATEGYSASRRPSATGSQAASVRTRRSAGSAVNGRRGRRRHGTDESRTSDYADASTDIALQPTSQPSEPELPIKSVSKSYSTDVPTTTSPTSELPYKNGDLKERQSNATMRPPQRIPSSDHSDDTSRTSPSDFRSPNPVDDDVTSLLEDTSMLERRLSEIDDGAEDSKKAFVDAVRSQAPPSAHRRYQSDAVAKGRKQSESKASADFGPREPRSRSQTGMSFGDASSSGNVPLAQSSSLQRKPGRKTSGAPSIGGAASPDGDAAGIASPAGRRSSGASGASRYGPRRQSDRRSLASPDAVSPVQEPAPAPAAPRKPSAIKHKTGNYI